MWLKINPSTLINLKYVVTITATPDLPLTAPSKFGIQYLYEGGNITQFFKDLETKDKGFEEIIELVNQKDHDR